MDIRKSNYQSSRFSNFRLASVPPNSALGSTVSCRSVTSLTEPESRELDMTRKHRQSKSRFSRWRNSGEVEREQASKHFRSVEYLYLCDLCALWPVIAKHRVILTRFAPGETVGGVRRLLYWMVTRTKIWEQVNLNWIQSYIARRRKNNHLIAVFSS